MRLEHRKVLLLWKTRPQVAVQLAVQGWLRQAVIQWAYPDSQQGVFLATAIVRLS